MSNELLHFLLSFAVPNEVIDTEMVPPGVLRPPANTTTISTIAVQSGQARIVIALLKAGHKLQFKVNLSWICDKTVVGRSK